MRFAIDGLALDDWTRAADAGGQAARQGQPDDPPHPRGSAERSAWLCGWRGHHRDEADARAWRAWLG